MIEKRMLLSVSFILGGFLFLGAGWSSAGSLEQVSDATVADIHAGEIIEDRWCDNNMTCNEMVDNHGACHDSTIDYPLCAKYSCTTNCQYNYILRGLCKPSMIHDCREGIYGNCGPGEKGECIGVPTIGPWGTGYCARPSCPGGGAAIGCVQMQFACYTQ